MSIGRIAARGVAWNMAIGVFARILQLVGNLVLLRLIAPNDYGEVLTAAICVGTAGQLTSFSFGQYLISMRAPANVAFQAATLHVAIGACSMVVVIGLGGTLGRWFDSPEMDRFIIGYAIAHLVERMRYVPDRLLVRALKFRTVASCNGAGEIAFTVTALALAPSWGGWAIVVGQVVRSVVIGALIFAFSPRAEWWAPQWPEAAAARALFGYGWPIMVGSLADRAASMWDNLIITKMFDPGVMAQYNQSYSLSKLPVDHVGDHIAEVLMPSFSRMEPQQRRSAVTRAASLMVLVVAPLSIGLSAVAPTLVEVVFNELWAPMAPMLMVLAAAFVFQPLPWSAISFLQTEQQTRVIMLLSFFNAIVVLSLVATLGTLAGPVGACFGAGIGFACYSVATILLAAHTTGFSARDYLVGVCRPVLACVPMFFGVTLVRLGLDELGVHPVLSLLLQVIAGAGIYIGAAFVVARSSCRELIGLVRRTRSKA